MNWDALTAIGTAVGSIVTMVSLGVPMLQKVSRIAESQAEMRAGLRAIEERIRDDREERHDLWTRVDDHEGRIVVLETGARTM